MSFNFLLQTGIEVTGETDPTDITVWTLISKSNEGMGWFVNLCLLAMFGYALYVLVERYMALRRATREEEDFLSKIKAYLLEGNIDAAKKFCSNSDGPSARMLEKGIERLGKPIENISSAIENTSKVEVMRLKRRIGFLATASGAGPFLGLLGSVIGIASVFMDVTGTDAVNLQNIAVEMISFIEGLIVGLIAYMGYNYLHGQIAKVVYTMESNAREFMDLLNEPGK